MTNVPLGLITRRLTSLRFRLRPTRLSKICAHQTRDPSGNLTRSLRPRKPLQAQAILTFASVLLLPEKLRTCLKELEPLLRTARGRLVTRWLPQQKNFGYFLLPTSSLLAFTNLSKKTLFCNPYGVLFSLPTGAAADWYSPRIPRPPACRNIFVTFSASEVFRNYCNGAPISAI